MKRFIILLAAAVMVAASFTACVAPTQVSAELSTSSEAPNPQMAEYTNDFEGLVKYMADSELIAGEGTNMSADFIGAEAGQKFAFKYKEAAITCELYSFDLENLPEKGREVLDSVKANGTFKSLDKDISAVLSDNGKFMMIYVCSSNDEAYLNFTDRMHEKFKAFNGLKPITEKAQ